MRARSSFALLTLAVVGLLGCRQPPAELPLTQPRAAEPSGFGQPEVFVAAATIPQPGPVLDWEAVDGRLAALIEGQRYRVDYDAEHPVMGSSAPLVTIVVFADYQCPFSKRLDETLALLLMDHRDALRVVWRQLPLSVHAQAPLAARYALAAHAQGRFEVMHAWLFANARSLSRASMNQAVIDLGLDPSWAHNEIDGGWLAERVGRDEDFAKNLGVNSTPTFFVNGRMIRGAQARAEIEVIINEEIITAQRLIDAGSGRLEVWARLLAASDPGPITRARPSTPTPTPAPTKRYTTQLAGLTPRGANPAKVEILMCGSFDCPFSARSTATLDELRKRHPSEVAIYFRHQPLIMHPHAMAAHRAAVAAANQGKFWAMFDLLYAEQRQRSPAELEALAKRAGLNLNRFRKDIADPQTDALIDQQRDFCEQQLDSRGTPGFFINGWPLAGAQPIDAFEAIITQELAATP